MGGGGLGGRGELPPCFPPGQQAGNGMQQSACREGIIFLVAWGKSWWTSSMLQATLTIFPLLRIPQTCFVAFRMKKEHIGLSNYIVDTTWGNGMQQSACREGIIFLVAWGKSWWTSSMLQATLTIFPLLRIPQTCFVAFRMKKEHIGLSNYIVDTTWCNQSEMGSVYVHVRSSRC
jgi:hypothetical protein